MGKPELRGGIGETESSILENRDFGNLERPIRFSFRHCNIKNYCVRKLDDREIQRFYDTLGKFEGITWKQVWSMSREKGFSAEKKDSGNHQFLKSINDLFSSFFHFRVNGTQNVFRVFAAQERDLCYILLLDKNGEINH